MNRIRMTLAMALFVGVLAGTPPVGAAKATTAVINNVEQKVNGEGPRGEAEQLYPDVSAAGWAVWWDGRGTATAMSASSVWSKDLNTHTEARVAALSTFQSLPRVSGNWVVWEDVVAGSREVMARQLPPTGPVTNVTNNPAAQGFPAIDGTKVVWEDSRNAGTTGIDIYLRDLAGGPETVVTQAPGDQVNPAISGNTVVWTDLSSPSEPRVLGRYLTDPPGSEFVIAAPTGASAEGPDVSGSRVVWTEGKVVMTCVLSGPGCGSGPAPVWSTDNVQAEPEVSGDRVVWLEGNGSDSPDPAWVWYRDLSLMGPNMAQLLDAPVNGARRWTLENGRPASARIDGTRAAWSAIGFRGPDIFAKDVAGASQPVQVNSHGLGAFADQQYVSAGSFGIAYLSDSGDFNPRNAVWATDLSGDRRTMRVSTFADFGTNIGLPKISGSRVTWSDARDGIGPTGQGELAGQNLLFRDLPGGDETRMTTAGIGNPPDVDGSRTAWLCQDGNNLCVSQNGLTTRLPLGVSDGFVVDNQVRLSGDVGLWIEFQFGDPEQPWIATDSRLHAVDLTTGEDEVLGAGSTRPAFVPSYDLSGANVAWVGSDGSGNSVIYRNTVAFPCDASCDRSGLTTALSSTGAMQIGALAMDGTTLAWTDFSPDFGADVWVKDVTAPTADPGAQVTTTGTAMWDVALYGGYAYWTDSRDENGFCAQPWVGRCDTDIYREYVGSGTAPAPLPADTAAPGVVGKLTALVSGSAIKVSWANPAASDFTGVIIVRKTAPARGKAAAATSFDDPNGTVVYDGPGTGFTDTDVNPATTSYTYTAFAYDEVPNYSVGVSTK